MSNITTILCPIDFSASSAATLGEACQVARDRKARLIALYVAPKAVVSHLKKVSELSPEEAREKLWEAIHQPYPEEATLDVEHRLEEGDPLQGILRVARESRCELIVLGMHPKSGWTGWLLGGMAEKVIRDAPCSVLVVKEATVAESQKQPSEATEPEQQTGISGEQVART